MPDASTLRSTLSRVDASAPGIQNAAAAMMRFYDRSAGVAVNEWRNALQTCSTSQLLPLLYVANEVLQNSKRNRGNKFLEAMSPVLTQSLQHVCSRDGSIVEKVRRTAKIWGDRRVFSIRFVNDILQGLEPYRGGGAPPPPPPPPEVASPGATFSPEPSPTPDNGAKRNNKDDNKNDDDGDDIDDILNDKDDDDDEDVFATNENSQKLEIEINIGSALDEMATSKASSSNSTAPTKRRRNSLLSQDSGGRKRRANILSASNLLDLWTRLAELQQRYEGAQLVLTKIDERLAKIPADDLSNYVGEELQQAYQQNVNDFKQMAIQRRNLHAIAREKHALEQEMVRYLPWLEKALKQDQDDIHFCDMLEQKIQSFQDIHSIIKKARDDRLDEEKRKEVKRQEKEKKKKEKEELERFRQAALAKETEAKPNMVWNPSTREYQYLNTDEDWRE